MRSRRPQGEIVSAIVRMIWDLDPTEGAWEVIVIRQGAGAGEVTDEDTHGPFASRWEAAQILASLP